jgi:hypothetical protein
MAKDSRAGRGSSADLVPTGLPHGERKATQQARQAAGLSSASRDIQQRAGAVASLGRTPVARRTQPADPQFDALLQTDPAVVGPQFASQNAAIAEAANMTLDERLEQTAEASNNDFLRGVVQRMRLLRGGG